MQLSVAAQQGDEATVKRLLAECAAEDVNFADERGLTPLHWACSCDEQAVAGLLLADPRADVDARSRHGMTAVHCAASANALRVLPMLLQSRASHLLGAPNEWGEAPLHVAATAGHAGAVKVLLSYGAATDVADRWGRTPSRVATQQGLSPEALDLPAETAPIEAASEAGAPAGAPPERLALQQEFMKVALERAERAGGAAPEVEVKHMFAPPSSSASGAAAEELARAVQKRAAAREEAAAAEAAASPAAAPAPAHSPVAPKSTAPPGKLALSKRVEYPGDPVEVARLLQSGEVAPAGKDMFGMTALHKFCAWDKVDLIELLLPYLDEEQCNVASGAEKQTPLHAAAEMGAARAVQRLLEEQRVDATALDGRGRSARQLAEQAGLAHIAELLP
mmetsp:Transcript_15687/g.47038  ORF Transcript_15687/g.47038 Transcript_15687/m.47038 type:complete len:393 (-) Transcript_15687:120-1298(-)